MTLSNIGHNLYVTAMGKKFLVTDIVKSMEEANTICAKDNTVGVIDETDNGLVIIAKQEPTA